MAIVTQTDKRSGITYAYDTEYYWDKDKKQSRSKRICVGKVDPVTGEIIPTKGLPTRAGFGAVQELGALGEITGRPTAAAARPIRLSYRKIGRASCRERV